MLRFLCDIDTLRIARWPGLLTLDSTCGEYYDAPLDKENEVTHYHVEFLGTPHSHAWVVAGLVHPFVSVPVVDKCPQFKNIQGRKLAEMKRSFYKALEEASRLVKMTLPERLATCRFKREGNEKNGGRSLFSSSILFSFFVFAILWFLHSTRYRTLPNLFP